MRAGEMVSVTERAGEPRTVGAGGSVPGAGARAPSTEEPERSAAGRARGACRECLRRSWLLAMLSVRLDCRSRDESRLLELLELDDRRLIEAIGGRRRRELGERWERFEPKELATAPGVDTVCRHGPGYPSALSDFVGAPTMLHVAGGAERLGELTAQPAVAIVGSARATDYGMEMACSLARGLAASGVTVVSALADGIPAAAHAGALEADGPTVTALAGGADVCSPASRRALCERVKAKGCAVAELPCGRKARRWCQAARARTVAGLAELTVVVEADESRRELTGARVARALGRTVAAVPGRVTSPVSRGTNALLMEGARLVRGPGDALDLLYGVGAGDATAPDAGPVMQGCAAERTRRAQGSPELEPRLRETLEKVGAGRDTPGKLTAAGQDAGDVLLALAELELLGLLARGDGGRYVPRSSAMG
ncbi:MAG TPA: DNA-processing protein DprA [Solirubrobacteraceae bacterium]|nr:DNA-processing protein DprA [Solirubrobacteraceae bacterium]